MMTASIPNIIEKYALAPHPEGGYYKEIYRSDLNVVSEPAGGKRSALTHIYFLLPRGEVSRFHRVVHDEIWHLYDGAPLELVLFDGNRIKKETIGPGRDHYTAVVPGNVWQAAQSKGDYSLMGCTVAPGFDFKDFSFLSDTPKDLAAFNRIKSDCKAFL